MDHWVKPCALASLVVQKGLQVCHLPMAIVIAPLLPAAAAEVPARMVAKHTILLAETDGFSIEEKTLTPKFFLCFIFLVSVLICFVFSMEHFRFHLAIPLNLCLCKYWLKNREKWHKFSFFLIIAE